MIETFEERCHREVGFVLAKHFFNKIESIVDYHEFILIEKYLRLLIETASMDFLPKKQLLDSETKQPYLVFTSKKPKTKIEYPCDHIRDILEKVGINIKMGEEYTNFKKIIYSKKPQKKRENKYFNIDMFK